MVSRVLCPECDHPLPHPWPEGCPDTIGPMTTASPFAGEPVTCACLYDPDTDESPEDRQVTEDEQWKRDIGPYTNDDQVEAQYRKWSDGIPGDNLAVHMLLAEPLFGTLGQLNSYEVSIIDMIGAKLSPVEAQVLAGLLMRVHLSGQRIP